MSKGFRQSDMKKRHVLLTFWFVLVLSVSLVIGSPLHYWKSFLQNNLFNGLEQGIALQKIEGHLWKGGMEISLPTLVNPVNIQWRLSFPLIKAQVTSKDFNGWGAISLGASGMDVWIDEARLSMDLFKPIARSNGVSLDGSDFVIDRLFMQLDYLSIIPKKWRGVGYLDSISAGYAFANVRQNAQLRDLSVEWTTRDQTHTMLLDSHEGKHLLTVEPTIKEELEISIMPALLNEVGIPWNGGEDYPVAVLVEPLY